MAGAAALALCAGAVLAGTTVAQGADGPAADGAAVPKPKPRLFGGDPAGDLGAVIRRTRYGVPHITARDYESRRLRPGLRVRRGQPLHDRGDRGDRRGERSRYFGPDKTWMFSGNSTDLQQPRLRLLLRPDQPGPHGREADARRAPPQGPLPEIKQAVRGFVARLQRLPARRGRREGRARPALQRQGLGAPAEGDRPLPPLLPARQPGHLGRRDRRHRQGARRCRGTARSPTSPAQALAPELGGGCATSAASARTPTASAATPPTTAAGMVLGNPHFPWAGAERLYQTHLTIPGKVDVSGATLYGVPAVLIGHTRGLAWSHTVATAWRFTPFELKLVPGDPHSYLVDGRPRQMKRDARDGKAGGRTARSRTARARSTRPVHGPMFTSLLGLPLFPWTPDRLRARRRQRDELPLPQPLLRERPGAVGARVRRDPAALPGHPVGQLAGGRQHRRVLLLDERRDPERARTRRCSALPDGARHGHLPDARPARRSTARARRATGAAAAGAADAGHPAELARSHAVPARLRRTTATTATG